MHGNVGTGVQGEGGRREWKKEKSPPNNQSPLAL